MQLQGAGNTGNGVLEGRRGWKKQICRSDGQRVSRFDENYKLTDPRTWSTLPKHTLWEESHTAAHPNPVIKGYMKSARGKGKTAHSVYKGAKIRTRTGFSWE